MIKGNWKNEYILQPCWKFNIETKKQPRKGSRYDFQSEGTPECLFKTLKIKSENNMLLVIYRYLPVN